MLPRFFPVHSGEGFVLCLCQSDLTHLILPNVLKNAFTKSTDMYGHAKLNWKKIGASQNILNLPWSKWKIQPPHWVCEQREEIRTNLANSFSTGNMLLKSKQFQKLFHDKAEDNTKIVMRFDSSISFTAHVRCIIISVRLPCQNAKDLRFTAWVKDIANKLFSQSGEQKKLDVMTNYPSFGKYESWGSVHRNEWGEFIDRCWQQNLLVHWNCNNEFHTKWNTISPGATWKHMILYFQLIHTSTEPLHFLHCCF